MKTANNKVTQIEVRGGNVHNLKNIDVNIPLNKFVAISGPSGSGKSSLAMGILYAEGSRRYLEALSTYTRRRISQSKQSDVKEIRHIPSAIALRQRPNVPSERSTVGSMSEIFNVVRLIFSRLGSTICPNGHRIQPSLKIAQAMDLLVVPIVRWGLLSVLRVALNLWLNRLKTLRLIQVVLVKGVMVRERSDN